MLFCRLAADFSFQNKGFHKKYFRDAIRVSNSSHLNQDRPDLDCLNPLKFDWNIFRFDILPSVNHYGCWCKNDSLCGKV